jgi:aspartate/methionine/tyrosine aminotransferase
LTDEEHEAFREAMREQRERIREDLAEKLGCSVEEVTADEYEMPDLDELESVPADEFYDE